MDTATTTTAGTPADRSEPSRIALSGAGGQLGSWLREALHARGCPLRSAGGTTPLQPLFAGEDIMHGDIRDAAVVDRMLTGIDVLIHLAGTSVERPLDEIIENNLRGLVSVYEGARRHRVRRVVFASSNHAIGMHPVTEKLDLGCEFRPDGFYGLSKMWGEGLARMYWDKHGIESVCVRIGSCLPRPTEPRHLSTWLGHDDMLHLLERCMADQDSLGVATIWGVSANTRSYWVNEGGDEGAARLGYRPVQNAEDWAAEILARPNPLTGVAAQHQGGAFVTIDYSRGDTAPRGRQ